jgi:CxxC motif-containing protein
MNKTKIITCIVCPKGCTLELEVEKSEVRGFGCKKGLDYGLNEIRNPIRTLTSTVTVTGGVNIRCPVKSAEGIPIGLIFDAMKQIHGTTVAAPIKRGDVLVANVAGSGINMIAGRNIASFKDAYAVK